MILRELERGLNIGRQNKTPDFRWIPDMYEVAKRILREDRYGQRTLLGKIFPEQQVEIREIPLGGTKHSIQIEAPNGYIDIIRTSRLVYDGRPNPEEVIYEVRHPQNPRNLIRTLAEIIK